jgi:type I restriction enzyme S subunit
MEFLEGMEFVGDIPEDWKWVKLGNIAEIKTGKTNSQDADNMGDYPLFDRSSVIKRSKKFLFDTEAVIVPGEGKEFIPRYYNGKFDLHQRTYAIFNFKESIPKFIYYNILLNKDIFKYFATGSTVLSLRLEHFLNFPIILPPIEEQKAIVEVLSSIDDKIELLHRQNKTLEEMAMTLFRQWFIEPTKDGLPDGWEEKKLKDICVITNGYAFKSSTYTNFGIKIIRTLNFGNSSIYST